MKWIGSLIVIGLTGVAFGKPSSTNALSRFPAVELEWRSEEPIKHWLFTKEARFDGPARLAPLASVKKLEFDENYEACTEKVLKIWSTYKEFRGWLALQGTQCLIYQMKFASVKKSTIYQKWWSHILKQDAVLWFGPWSRDWDRAWAEWVPLVMKNTSLPVAFRAEVAELWRTSVPSLTRSDRQDLYQLVAESLKEQHRLDVAESSQLRESLLKGDNLLGNGAMSSANGAKVTDILSLRTKEEKEEEEAYKVFLEALTANKISQASELALALLKKYPNGRRATVTQEKWIQAYFSLRDSVSTPEQKTQLQKILDDAKKLHPSRLIEWAKSAHRRGDFQGALVLAERALKDESESADGASLHFIAGRSAYFLGQYKSAVSHFDALMQRHSGYTEIWEVRFRRALAFIRQGQDQKAEEALSELSFHPENKTYALASMYWLARLKQKRKAPIDDLMVAIQDRFALTYYGLKLLAEANQQKLIYDRGSPEVPIKQSWVLSPAEKKQWERAQDLARAGWYVAAQAELNTWTLAGNTEQKFLWTHQLAQLFAYPQALRSYNELIDLDGRWRRPAFLKTVFPKPLEDVVRSEAQKNDLHPLLIYSLIRQESAFQLAATSRSQAKGLMQLIPLTSVEVAQDLRVKNFHPDQMYHPVVNIRFGAHYLAKVIRQFGGNVSVGLAAYNAGPHRLKKFFEGRVEVENPAMLSQEDPWSDLWIEELPWLETNLYVKSILRNRVIYELLEQGRFDWPVPVWKDLYLGSKSVSRSGKPGVRLRQVK